KMAQLQNLEAHGVRPDAPCFNTGVLLMDLRSWRKERLTEKVISLARRHPEQLHTADQNAINLAFHGRIGMLGPEWNVQPVYRRIRSGEWSDIPTLPRFEGKPKIFHFLSEEKPWLPGCEVPERTHFHRLWQKTKWPVPAFVTAEALPVPVPEPGPRLRKEFPERVPQGD
ncbi:MAG: glycosyltransferase family 8 protein, partial [Bdellovibrionota bacterium]